MRTLSILAMAALALGLGACDSGTRVGDNAMQTDNATNESMQNDTSPGDVAAAPPEEMQEEVEDARDLITEATQVVRQMKADPEAARLLDQAKGVFIVPEYGKGAAIVGARGGEGVLFAHQSGGQGGDTSGSQWTGPMFYDIGAISVGPQLGGSGGDVAMLLMTQRAVDSFKQDNNFSFNANAGFELFDYSAQAQASAGKGDVIFWSDTEGAFAGVSLGVSDISWDDEENRAFYNQEAQAGDVLDGRVASPQASAIRNELSG